MSLVVVQFAREDLAGVGAKIRAAMRSAGHVCRLVTRVGTYLDYPRDLSPGDARIPGLLARADLIICHGAPGVAPRLPGVPRVVYVHGTRFRRRPSVVLAQARRWRARVVASTVDLSRHGPEWSPTPIDTGALWALRSPMPRGPLRVAHSPTSRPGKGTGAFLGACVGLDGVDPVIIEGVSNAECLRIKATCHAAFDSLAIGMQVSGLEAAAMGLPVLAGGDDYVERETRARFGGRLPYLRTNTVGQIRDALVRLRDDAAFWRRRSRRALRYARDVHGFGPCAERIAMWAAKRG